MATYRIIDEPRPSKLSAFSVNPFWIFLATMLGAASIGWLWFLFNGYAFGSPTKRKETLIVAGGVVGVSAFVYVAARLVLAGILTRESPLLPYLEVVLVAIKIGVAYLLHLTQRRGFELYTHYGGRERNGFLVLALMFLFRVQIFTWLGPAWGRVLL